MRSRGETAKGGKHAFPRVGSESGAAVRQWRRRSKLSTEQAARLIGVRPWGLRHIEDGGPVRDEELRKVVAYMAEHAEVGTKDVYTPQELAKRLRASKAVSLFRQAITETFFSCWDELCAVCGKCGKECEGCKWQREGGEGNAEVSDG